MLHNYEGKSEGNHTIFSKMNTTVIHASQMHQFSTQSPCFSAHLACHCTNLIMPLEKMALTEWQDM
jgi:hypothetical protein